MTDVLAGEPAADNVDGSDVISGKSVCCEVSDILELGDEGPVLSEHGAGVGVDFTEGDGSHPGSLEAEGESADAGKEVEDIQIATLATSLT